MRLHFVGIAGSGMRVLAQLALARGHQVSGSDRALDRGAAGWIRELLEARGARITPQDGSGVTVEIDAVVVSTAVESRIPDYARAVELGIPILHRARFLAELTAGDHTIAVAGTSGKTTTTGMIGVVLACAGRDPTVLCGGDVLDFADEQGRPVGFRLGAAGLTVMETDESDGSIRHFGPTVGVLTNIGLDHKPLPEIRELFAGFLDRCREGIVAGGDCAEVRALLSGRKALTFGLEPGADVRAEAVESTSWGSRFRVEGCTFELRVPGRFNVLNALAAIAVGRVEGIPLEEVSAALATFRGIRRRTQILGRRAGVTVIDDFAHNPDKIAAVLGALQEHFPRLCAVFQPHGFGPVRMMGKAYVQAFAGGLRSGDRLILCPIYYAGGTVARDVSSEDIAGPLAAAGHEAEVLERAGIPAAVARWARAGDGVVIMGARDDSLSDLGRRVLAALPGGC
jgi:UDP-N-acetylmuramate--alanine ligase